MPDDSSTSLGTLHMEVTLDTQAAHDRALALARAFEVFAASLRESGAAEPAPETDARG